MVGSTDNGDRSDFRRAAGAAISVRSGHPPHTDPNSGGKSCCITVNTLVVPLTHACPPPSGVSWSMRRYQIHTPTIAIGVHRNRDTFSRLRYHAAGNGMTPSRFSNDEHHDCVAVGWSARWSVMSLVFVRACVCGCVTETPRHHMTFSLCQ